MAAPKDRDDEVEEGPNERRRREKKDRDPNRPHKSSKKSSRSKIDPETGENSKSSHRRRREKDGDSRVNFGDAAPEIAKTMSRPDALSRSSLPYPSFSKAHSKEAVRSVPKLNLYTPDPTDVAGGVKMTDSKENLNKSGSPPKNERPPSPPDTEFSQQKATSSSVSQVQEEGASRSSSRASTHSISRGREEKPKVSSQSKTSTTADSTKSKSAQSSKLEDGTVRGSDTSANFVSHSTIDSDATSVAPRTAKSRKAAPSRLRTSDTDSSAQDSSPRTPTQAPQFPPPDAKSASFLQPSINGYGSAVPPPPPPPPPVPVDLPRVDYLLHNGGLPKTVPKSLFGPDHNIEKIFRPCLKILQDYQRVLECKGSLAVATGHKSVARRLLDRLEVVFQRELSSDSCVCALCQDHSHDCDCSLCRLGQYSGDEDYGTLSWGDILEWVSGRIELPVWPAFDFNSMGMKATEDSLRANYGPPRPGSPVKIDPDIAEEFREHYLRQSEKKKKNIDNWLASCPDTAIPPPPHHIDDETLTFTILTHLENEKDREFFNALLAGVPRPVDARTPSPFRRARSEFIAQTGRAIQRLYRLLTAPRDPEAAVYLLKNPKMHNLLITLTGINNSEWEVLTSGRFDGFLWSGAESEFPSMNNSPNISRNPTPANGSSFSPNRKNTFSPSHQQASRSQTSTPFSPGLPTRRQPVSNDEEMEIAITSEIERNLYQYMEVFEDAFEDVHRQVENMRQALRQRVAGLSLAAQLRRPNQPEIVCSTPGLGPGYERGGNGFGFGDGESEMSENDWLEEQQSEIGPSDSASQISSNRFKRPKRRNQRRTPALVEEDEGDD